MDLYTAYVSMSDKEKYQQNKEISILVTGISDYIVQKFSWCIYKQISNWASFLKDYLNKERSEFEKNVASTQLLDTERLNNLKKRFSKESLNNYFLRGVSSILHKDSEKYKFMLKNIESIVLDLSDYLRWNESIKFWPISIVEWENIWLGDILIEKTNYESLKLAHQKICNTDNKSEFMIGLRVLYAILKSGIRENEKTIVFNLSDASLLRSYLDFSYKFPFANSHKKSKILSQKYLWYFRRLIEKFKLTSVVLSDKRKDKTETYKLRLQN